MQVSTQLLTQPDLYRRVLTTLTEMIHDRGYEWVSPSDWNITHQPDTFYTQYYTDQASSLFIAKQGTCFYHVQACLLRKMNIEYAREFISQLPPASSTEKHYYLIVTQAATTEAVKTLEQTEVVQVLYLAHLYRNITRHVLYQKHWALTPTEVEQLLTQRKCTKQQLPRILRSDPVVQYFNWPKNTVVAVQRRYGGLQEPQIIHRVVTAALPTTTAAKLSK